jgi:catechol 2,3-dioxygenase-like lactoylglutathione lyase family enzyme
MITFYTALGFYEIARSDFAPSPIRSALLQNDIGARLEVTAHGMSVPVIPQVNAAGAAEQRGIFHFAMRVDDLERAVSGAAAAGATLISAPALNSRGDGRFAYIADPEGNLLELVGGSKD